MKHIMVALIMSVFLLAITNLGLSYLVMHRDEYAIRHMNEDGRKCMKERDAMTRYLDTSLALAVEVMLDWKTRYMNCADPEGGPWGEDVRWE